MKTTHMRAMLLLTTALCAAAASGPALSQDATGDTLTLDDIKVEGSSYQTEGTGSYRTDRISVGEKAAMSPREVPQSTVVITDQQIKDGGYTALETALSDAPGLMILNNDIGRSSIFSRGFEFDYLYFDGLPAPVSSIYGTQPDLSIVDHVEVLKGPSGLFTGTGEPAGAINMRLKQATRTDPGGSVTTSLDSNGQARVSVDYGGKLNTSGTLRGRFVLTYADGDGYVDMTRNGVKVAYGTLAWDITPDTSVTFSLSRMKRDIKPFNGLPTYADGSLMWLEAGATTAADWNTFRNDVTDGVVAVEHRLGGGARLKFSLRQSYQSAEFLYAYAGSTANAANQISRLTWLARDFSQHALALDAHAEIPFALGSWSGLAILGADYQRTTSTTLQASGAIAGTFDLDNWDVSNVARPTVTYTSRTGTRSDSKGLYAQLRLKPNQALTLIGGARLSWVDSTSYNYVAGTASRISESGKVTPFAGVTYDISPTTTLYASYSEIFQPQDYTDASGKLLDPVEGKQYEIGAKATLPSGLDLSAAIFQLEEVNRPLSVTDASGAISYVAQEKVRVRGAEVTASGEIGPNLHLSAGYTYTDTTYVNGPSAGQDFSTYTPANMLKLTLEYDVTRGALQGWSFGGRLRAMSGFSSRGIEAPGYSVVDVMARRQLDDKTQVALSVTNLFDRAYYTRVGSTTVFNFRGAPRAVGVTLTRSF